MLTTSVWPAQDKGHDAVVMKAMGRAINKTVTIGSIHILACESHSAIKPS